VAGLVAGRGPWTREENDDEEALKDDVRSRSLVEQVVEETGKTDVDDEQQHEHSSTFTPVLPQQTINTYT